MREWTLTARISRAWFVVALSAVAGLTIASPLASAQATEDADDAAPAQDAAPSAPEGEGEPAEPADGEQAPPGDETSAGDSVLQPGDIDAEQAATEEDVAAAEEAPAPAPEPLPWRNSFFSWTHGVTPNTFFRGSQLSYNPNYYWSFNLAPRWYVDSSTFFFVSQTLFYELTNDDGSSAYNHDLILTDTIVDLRRVMMWEGFILIPSARVVLPASKASQAAQRYFGLAGGLTAVKVFPELAGLTFAAIGRYQYWFAGRNTPATMSPYPGDNRPTAPFFAQPTPVDGAGSYLDAPMIDQASGLTSARHIVVAGITINVTPFEGFTVSGAAFWLSQEGHGLADACFHAMTSPTAECLPDQSRTHWRHSTSLSLSVAYDVQPWLNLSLGWSNAAFATNFFNPDGSVRGPFNPDNNFFLTASIQIDSLYQAFSAGEDDGLTPEQRQRRRQGLAGVQSTTGGSF